MKLRDHTAILAKSDAFRVNPRDLKVENGFNVRDLSAPAAQQALDELKEQIRADGVQVPLEIRLVGDDLFVVSGHRRLHCVMALIAEGVEIDSVPAIAEPRAIGDAERTARLITLNGGEPLSGLEKAEVVRRLMGYGWTREKIAARLGFKTTQQVANLEKLLEAPQDVRDAVRAGELSATNAVAMVRSEGALGAGAALMLAREAAKAAGKRKITTRSLPQTKPDAPQKPQGNQGALDKAMALLKGIIANDYDARVAATLFMMPADNVSAVIEWLTVFEDRLRDRQEERREASTSGAQRTFSASLQG